MKGLIVKKHWLDLILSGKKPWEIRGSNTKIRGTICLIESGTGMIKGTTILSGTIPIERSQLPQYEQLHRIEDTSIVKYKTPYAWVMERSERLPNPIPYKHPQGAITWVNLPDDILEGVIP